MDPAPLLERVLDDEGLTAGLDEPEATLLVEALTKRVQTLAAGTTDAAQARRQTDELSHVARQIAQAAASLRDQGEAAARAAAAQGGLRWPAGAKTPLEVVRRLLGALDRRTG
ncbi:MAG TPA: hypothetical protein VKD90_27720 [Gemmataceae bacterium]|nr:hypothetical protein [Gemmataceae bacterium]